MGAKRVQYFEIDVLDRPGVLADFLAVLRDQKVNLKGLWGFGVGMGKAQIFSVPQNPDKFLKAAKLAGYTPREGVAFQLTGTDKIGALCNILDKVKLAGLNIHAVDAIGVGGKFGCYIWAEQGKAEELSKALAAK